jgi:ABC-type nickel/cobalt efflux system permease component RcnA
MKKFPLLILFFFLGFAADSWGADSAGREELQIQQTDFKPESFNKESFSKSDFKKAFAGKKEDQKEEDQGSESENSLEPDSDSGAGFFQKSWTSFLNVISRWQKWMREEMIQFTDEVKANPMGSGFWSFLLLCMLYGMAHALGPGHGKSVVMSFFLGRRATWKQGVSMSLLITFTHVISAVLVVMILLKASGSVFAAFEGKRFSMESISYVLLMIIGVFLLVLSIKHLLSHKPETDTPKATRKEILSTAFITGMIPCPATATILLFTSVRGMVWLGLLGSLFIFAGMAITTSAFALLSIFGKDSVLRRFREDSPWFHRIHHGMEFSAALLIIFLGAALFFGRP